jgi:hypothetical protein
MADVELVLSNLDLGDEPPTVETETVETVGDEGQETSESQTEAAEEQESSEATQETTEEPAKASAAAKDVIPLATHMELKHQLRDARALLAQLQAQQMVGAQAQQTEPTKSPMEKFIETEGKDAVPPAEIHLAQEQWRQDQAAQKATTTATTTAAMAVHAARVSLTDETVGEGLGFDTVLQLGHTLLTEGDKLDVRMAGENAGTLLYQKCLERLVRSNTPAGNLVKAAVRAVRAAKPIASTITKTKTVQTREAPTREQVLNPNPTRLQGAGDLTGFYGF